MVSMSRTATLFCATVLAASLAPWSPLRAQNSVDGFVSPSRNVYCMANASEGAFLRCDMVKIDRVPKRPRDCDLDYGTAFEVSDKDRPGARICHGDTIIDEGYPTLPYGGTFERLGFRCASEQRGVTCRNAHGRGFFLSRGRQELF